MPRLPVDGTKVREIRVTMGSKERQLLESALGAFQFNRVATPIVAGMSDVSFMLVVAGLLSAIFPQIVIPSGIETIDEIIDAIIRGLKQAREERENGGLTDIDRPWWQYIFEEGTIFGGLFS